MKERPMLFSGPMVRAILDGRKTQTRRIVKPQPERGEKYEATEPWLGDDGLWRWMHGVVCREETARRCPYGVRGDRLWVRECFSYVHGQHSPQLASEMPVWYWADGNPEHGDWTRPKPSIHMPRWASRLTLEVTGVRVERVRDISDNDAEAEGVVPPRIAGQTVDIDGNWWAGAHRNAFFDLFFNLNKRAPADSNPWVWVIEFKRVTL